MLSFLDQIIWEYAAVPILMLLGLYLTFVHRFPQFKLLYQFFQTSPEKTTDPDSSKPTVTPWEAFFASLGGCIGIGNVIAVCTAIQIGGPGALLWMQFAAFLGMMIKYSEVFISIKTRFKIKDDYFGGPFIYLSKGQGTFLKIVAKLFAVLLIIYSADVYMFKVVADVAHDSLKWPLWAIFLLVYLPLLLIAQRGLKVVGHACSLLIPVFLIIFIILCLTVLYNCADNILPSLRLIFDQAFGLSPVVGGAAGATLMTTVSEGVKRGCYSGDIGVGYAGLVHSKTTYPRAMYQASYEILGVLVDTFLVCTLSTFVIIVANTYSINLPASQVLQYTMSQYFPGMQYFFPVMIVLLGYSTLLTFFYVGRQCAMFLSQRWGSILYTVYSFAVFSYFLTGEQDSALTFMSLVGAFLLILNCLGLILNHSIIQVDKT